MCWFSNSNFFSVEFSFCKGFWNCIYLNYMYFLSVFVFVSFLFHNVSIIGGGAGGLLLVAEVLVDCWWRGIGRLLVAGGSGRLLVAGVLVDYWWRGCWWIAGDGSAGSRLLVAGVLVDCWWRRCWWWIVVGGWLVEVLARYWGGAGGGGELLVMNRW